MRHTRVALFVHLIWATWDRQPLLTPDIEAQIHRAIAAKCAELGAQVIALGGIEDHIHLLVRIPATLPVATLVQQAKGASSHLATHAADAPIFKWQGAYGAFSVSTRDLEHVSAYIQRQREHHTAKTLVPEWEAQEN